MKHKHKNAHEHIELYSGGHFEVCECGASRKVEKDGTVKQSPTGGRWNATTDRDGWHTCDLCVTRK